MAIQSDIVRTAEDSNAEARLDVHTIVPDLFALQHDGHDHDGWIGLVRDAERCTPLISIGSYDVLAEISRGGQGTIFFAKHRDSAARVAIKRMIKGPMSGSNDRHRFMREIDAIGTLRHPNIVKLLSVEIDSGQPHLAMEWIDGIRITRWAAGQGGTRRSIQEVVDLMIQVCSAVRHAHQRGIIHRDLKPSNILVDAHDRPHLLDFGLAKLKSDDTPDPTVTRSEQFLGTIAYASPEQLRCAPGDIDARSDIYSLGVILYESLTGRTPFLLEKVQASGAAIHHALERVMNQTPPRPSSLRRGIDSDLNAIVLKALRVEPEHRYQSVDALNNDLERWRHGAPIDARGPGTMYLLRKLLKRHRTAVAFAGAVASLVLIGAVVATVFAARLAVAREQEHQARLTSEQINQFLHDMLSASDPMVNSAHGEITARQLLDQASVKLRDEAEAQQPPLVQAALHQTIGTAYMNLGLYTEADEHLTRSLALRKQHLGTDGVDTIHSLGDMATLRYLQERLADAAEFAEQCVQHARTLSVEDVENSKVLATALNNLAAIRRAEGDLDSAQQLFRESLEIQKSSLGEDHPDVAIGLNNLSNVYRIRGNHADAERLCRQALDIRVKHHGERHMIVAQSMANLGTIIYMRGESDEWRPLLIDSLQMHRDLLGPDHPHVAHVAANFGQMLLVKREFEESEAALRDAIRIRMMTNPEDFQNIVLQIHYGSCLIWLKRYEEAQQLLARCHEQVVQIKGANDAWAYEAAAHLARLHEEQGNLDEAARWRELLPPAK